MKIRHVAIIGNGIAGITAARHIRKRSDHAITVISAETDYFFSRTALMYIYMGHMRFEDTQPYESWFWRKNRIDLLRGYVEGVDAENRRLRLRSGQELAYNDLLIASGSRSNRFGWSGQDLKGVQGLYSYQDLQQMEHDTVGIEHAVIVGGGLIGVEVAEMLLSRGVRVTFLVREGSWMEFAFPGEESAMINRHIADHEVDLRLSTELERILPDADGRARAVVTRDGEEIPCQFVALTVGVSPNIGFLEGSAIECDRGALVDSHLATNVPGVYAAGDCAQLRDPGPGRRAIEPVWYSGRRMGETIARTLSGEPTAYDPGIWFNSAKFFDIEWQIYGDVRAELPPDQASLFWEHASGRQSIRINYRIDDDAVVGFNLMGVRYRHEVCDRWIRERRPIRDVLANLAEANFDPEFFRRYEDRLVGLYNGAHPDRALRPQGKRRLWGLLQFSPASSGR